MRALAYLGLVCLTGVSFEVRAASHALVLRGVEIVQGQGADAGVTYELECGEKLFGVLVREVDHAVGIAVVLDRPEVGCSLMAEHKTLALPFLSTRGRDLVSLPTNEVTPKVHFGDIHRLRWGPVFLGQHLSAFCWRCLCTGSGRTDIAGGYGDAGRRCSQAPWCVVFGRTTID